MLNNLKIWQKLALFTLAFFLPMGALGYFVVKGVDANIRFAQWESYGDRYQRPLERLLRSIAQHGFLVRQYDSVKGEDLRKQIAAKEGEVDAAFVELQTVDKELGEPLQFTAAGLEKRNRVHIQIRNVLPEWNEIKGRLDGMPLAASDEKHAHLAADVRTMITHSGDMSNLILDPDLDSYYLMDVTLLALPQTQDRLASVLNHTWDLLRGGEISVDDRTKLAVEIALLRESDRDRIVASSNTSLTEDRNFYGVTQSLQDEIPRALAAYGVETNLLLDVLGRIVSSPQPNVSPEEFARLGAAAHEAAFVYWDKAVTQEDALLANRISALRGDKIKAFALTGVALAIALFLAYLVTRSISRPLEACAQALKGHAEFDFTHKLDLKRRDEIGAVAAQTDALADALRGTAQRIAHQAQVLVKASSSLMQKAEAGASIAEMAGNIRDVHRASAELNGVAERFKV